MGETHSQPYVQYSWAGYSLTVWANKGRVSPGCRGGSWAPLSVCVPGREGGVWRATSCLSFFLLLLLFCFVLFVLLLFFDFCIGPVIAVPMQRLRGAMSPFSAR